MCLATPVRIKRLAISDKRLAILDSNREIDISLIPDAKVGDWLLCHADLAVQKLDEKAAKEILALSSKCSHANNELNK